MRGEFSTMSIVKERCRAFLVVGFIILLLNGCASAPVIDYSGSPKKTYILAVDYSKVPQLVNKELLTLKVDVGFCSAVIVEADSVTLNSRYKAGGVIFTTSAKNITITALNWTASGSGKAVKAYLFDNRNWAFSQTFDDGYLDVWENAKPILDEKGWKAGLAVCATFAAAAWGPNMSWEQMETLQKSGWDIFNHGYSHLHMTCDDYKIEFDENNKEFKKRFPGYNVTQIVYPFEDSGFTECRGFPPSYLLSAQKGKGSAVTYVDQPIEDLFKINRSGQYSTDNSRWKEEADAAAVETYPSWIIKITHHVYPGSKLGSDPAYSTTQDALKDFYSYLDSKYGARGDNSMWFAPAGEVMDYLLTRDNAVVSVRGIY